MDAQRRLSFLTSIWTNTLAAPPQLRAQTKLDEMHVAPLDRSSSFFSSTRLDEGAEDVASEDITYPAVDKGRTHAQDRYTAAGAHTYTVGAFGSRAPGRHQQAGCAPVQDVLTASSDTGPCHATLGSPSFQDTHNLKGWRMRRRFWVCGTQVVIDVAASEFACKRGRSGKKRESQGRD
ncbi:hypothetical protein C8R43DRAFT_1126545 [Mycena crocata]|nr:hypothetical protein C8R43DRAFT_1126545 [Mycena crocata]